MHVCFSCVRFSFSVLSQEMCWEEHFGNDLFCVGWDVKPSAIESNHGNELNVEIYDLQVDSLL